VRRGETDHQFLFSWLCFSTLARWLWRMSDNDDSDSESSDSGNAWQLSVVCTPLLVRNLEQHLPDSDTWRFFSRKDLTRKKSFLTFSCLTRDIIICSVNQIVTLSVFCRSVTFFLVLILETERIEQKNTPSVNGQGRADEPSNSKQKKNENNTFGSSNVCN
jgi:hypothetical protein